MTAGGVEVRILNRCNFRCPACPTSSGPHRRGRLSLADFRRIIDTLAAAHFAGDLTIVGGEAALHPDLPAMLTEASRRLPAVSISVYTNGSWVGSSGWRDRLGELLAGPNVQVRFSLDRRHAEGAIRARTSRPADRLIQGMERERLEQARLFRDACLDQGAAPGVNFGFALTGSLEEARLYAGSLGDVPLCLNRARRDRSRLSAPDRLVIVGVDDEGCASVSCATDGLTPRRRLGGLEALPAALAMSRTAGATAAPA